VQYNKGLQETKVAEEESETKFLQFLLLPEVKTSFLLWSWPPLFTALVYSKRARHNIS